MVKKILIQDIAKEMGLSRNTVAKALKNDESVLGETKKRVIETAYNMGYSKLSKETLKQLEVIPEKEEKIVKEYAVMIGAVSSDFWNGIIVGISDEINRYHGRCVVNFIKEEDEEALILPSNIDSSGTEGIICLSVFSDAYTKKVVELGLPMVFLDSPVRRLPYEYVHDIVMIEGEQSIYEITTDLIKRGCKKIGFIGDITYCQSLLDRFRGFNLALKDGGVEAIDKFCMVKEIEGRYYKKEPLLRELQALDEVPDAFVCANDNIAILVIQYYKGKGLNIPKDLAVTGFDNKKESLVIEPHITTVNITNYRLGCRLVNQLMWRIEHPTMYKEIITVTTEVYFRESSDC